jgi:hypothetical protein
LQANGHCVGLAQLIKPHVRTYPTTSRHAVSVSNLWFWRVGESEIRDIRLIFFILWLLIVYAVPRPSSTPKNISSRLYLQATALFPFKANPFASTGRSLR